MVRVRIVGGRITPTVVLAAVGIVALVACGSGASSTSAGSSASAQAASSPAALDLAKLLIQPTDIPMPGFTQENSQPVNQAGVNGVSALFASADSTRALGDTIVVLPDAASAAAALQAAGTAAQTEIQGATPTPAQVGTGGMVYVGTSAAGTKASTLLVFQEGKALVTMQFDSAANDVVPPDMVTTVGAKQDQLLKAGLPA